MPSTLVHGLLPPACLATRHRAYPGLTRWEQFKLLFLSAIIANSPDLDVIPASLMPSEWANIHREWGHNLFTVTVLCFVGAWALRRFVSPKIPQKTALLTTVLLIASHLFLDSMTGVHPEIKDTGVPLFWPISATGYNLPWRIFPCYHVDKTVHPLLAYTSAIDYWKRVVFTEFLSSVSLFAIWLVASLGGSSLWRLLKRGRSPINVEERESGSSRVSSHAKEHAS